MERERKREELLSEQGEGRRGDSSYRGEQVELSFSARNRKGPAGAPTSRETRQRVPTARSYSENLFAARHIQQQQQQQSLIQTSQQDSRGGGPIRRQYPAPPQSKIAAPRRAAANRPSQSSSSSMGSELDDADNEVQWFSDLAFSSLSSPEVDYLDMYNSSHRSSTNASQPSTQDSPAAANAAWLAYAEFKGSAPRLDNEDFLFQQPGAYYSDGLDPSRRSEMGSFECVDVAVEREEPRKGKRCVPKRQIQLKRKTAAEMMQDESSENSSPLITDSPSLQRRSKDTFVRQHSTPAAMEESYRPEPSPEPIKKNERKSKLQKSASLDETCTSKTTMATCLIKSVLSKKMRSVDKQNEDRETPGVSPASEDKTPPPQCAVAPLRESPKSDAHHLSPSLRSDHSLSSEELPLRRDSSPHGEGRQQKNFAGKFSNRPSPNNNNTNFTLSESDREWSDSQRRQATSSGTPEMRSEFTVPFDGKPSTPENIIPGIGGERGDDGKGWEERQAGDSANATTGISGPRLAARACSAEARTTDSEQECEGPGTEDHSQLQQYDNSTYMSYTPEITFKASPAPKNKKKTSLNVSLSPDLENRPELHRDAPSPDVPFKERLEGRAEKSEEVEENGNNRVKAPMHKVRDVRKLVKNTYNLSFKATSPVLPSFGNDNEKREAKEERREEIKEERKEEKIKERREARKELRTEETREEMAEQRVEERGEELREERKEGRKAEVKLPPVSPSLQRKATPLSRPQQPMQIECKAVCWKEDKNKMTPSKAESEKTPQKLQASSLPPADAPQESHTTAEEAKPGPTRPRPDAEKEAQSVEVKGHKTTADEVKSEVVRRDKKPPMLGSLPKVPSKDREVSTAVVLIRDGSSKTRRSPSPAQDDIQSPLRTQSVSPSRPTSSLSPGSGGHSVSMILKEKGYQADIGAVVGEGQPTSGAKGVPQKHVNRLEIPLQTNTHSDGCQAEPRRERTFSSSSTKSGPPASSDRGETRSKVSEEDGNSVKSTSKDATKQNGVSTVRHMQQHQTPSQTKQKEPFDFEAVKRQDPTFPPKSPAPRRFRPQPIEVKSMSKEPQQPEVPGSNLPSSRPQTIEVKSIANNNSQKPMVPPKPNYKFKPADLGPQPNETPKPTEATSGVKLMAEERHQTIVVSSPTIYRKLSNETTSASNYTRKLAVSAVSSYKPPPGKTTAAIPGTPSRSTALSETEASDDRVQQQQQPGTSPQSSRHTQRPTTLATAPISAAGPGVTSAPGPIPALAGNQVPGPSTFPGPASAVPSQSNQPAVMDLNSQPQHRRTTYTQEQALTVTSNSTKQSAAVSTTQVPGYTHAPRQQYHRSLSNEHSQRMDDLRFYASDDPPSYDERESFSPLMLPDLTARKPHRYHPSSRPPPCSCASGCPSHPGLTPPHHHHHHSPRNLTPPAPSHSPGQALPYPMAQPHPRAHHCRSDPLPMSYQPSSPKSSPMGPSQPPPAMYQSLHQPPACPPHPSLMQPPSQQIDPRRPPVHRSPQQQPPGVAGGPYSDHSHSHSHSHSPNLPPMDAQYLCGPQSLGPSYGSDYGGDNSSLYSESSYGQTPRRVLMDPETGKYFYIEVPVQPLRKMLFDPETGQYVEVLIPQQAMSHSGLYPPSAAPYPSLHNPNMYATAPQYLPYGAPQPQPHPQAQPQPPRHPEASAPAAMHQSGPGTGYGNPSGQGSKPEPQGHPPLDQSYLESMYYVPTGMNASPNPTDCYHKHAPGQPNAGGKRS